MDHMIGKDGGFACDRTQRDNIINYINLRYDLDRGLGIYNGNKIKSAVFRQKGTGATITSSGGLYYFESSSSDGTLNLSETGQTEIYTLSGKRLKTSGSATNNGRKIRVSFISGSETTEDGITWWLGDTIDPDAMRSYLQIGSIQSLGGNNPNFLDLGAFLSDFIIDDTTADAFLDHQAEWHFFQRTSAIFNTWWYAAGLDQTDCILLDHPRLPPDDRPVQITTLSQNVGESAGSINVVSSAGLSTGDYLKIGSECLKLGNNLSVNRGQLGTNEETHLSGEAVYRIDRKFFVKHIGYSPASFDWRISAEAFPV